MKKTSYLLTLLILLLIGVSAVFSATSVANITGYAWSSGGLTATGNPQKPTGVGWIKANPGTTAAPLGGIKMATDGTFSGYAWANPYDTVAHSKNFGWLSFNSSLGCPGGGNCTPRVPISGTRPVNATGWARFVANDGENGNAEYTGWLHLSGTTTNGGSYAVTYDPGAKTLKGWAWGGKVVGWVYMDYVVEDSCTVADAPSVPTNVVATGICDSSGNGNNHIDVSWNFSSGFVPGGGYYVYRTPLTGHGTETRHGPVYSGTSWTDSNVTVGTAYSYRISAFNNTCSQVTESAKSSPPVSASVVGGCTPTVSPDVSLKCAPPNVPKGDTATLTWIAPQGSQCSITSTDPSFTEIEFPTLDTTGEFPTAPINQTRTYTLTCTEADSEPSSSNATCYVAADYQHF